MPLQAEDMPARGRSPAPRAAARFSAADVSLTHRRRASPPARPIGYRFGHAIPPAPARTQTSWFHYNTRAVCVNAAKVSPRHAARECAAFYRCIALRPHPVARQIWTAFGAGLHPAAVSDDVELLIAGGGLTGLLLGAACASAGLAVAIVDRQDPVGIARASGSTAAARPSLSARTRCSRLLGLWRGLAARCRADPRDSRRRRRVSLVPALRPSRARDRRPARLHRRKPRAAAGASRTRQVDAEPHSAGPARRRLGSQLTARHSSRALGWAQDQGSPRRGGRRPNSPLRRAAGIKTVEWRYRQTGIVTTVRHRLPHNGVAVEHFLPAGPFAILPMTGDRSSIVWTERAELAPRLIDLSDADFAGSSRRGLATSSAMSSRSARAGPTRWGCCWRNAMSRPAWRWSARRRI